LRRAAARLGPCAFFGEGYNSSMRVPLRYKILAGQTANLALVLLVWLGAFYLLSQLGQSANSILRENYRSIEAAQGMVQSLRVLDAAQLRLLLGQGASARREFAQAQNTFAQWLAIQKANITIPGEQSLTAAVESLYTDYLDAQMGLATTAEANSADAVGYYETRCVPIRDHSLARLDSLIVINRAQMYSASRATHTMASRSLVLSVVGGLLVLLGGILFSSWLSKRISEPVRRLTELSHEVAEGNLDVFIRPTSHDEIGQLASEFDRMVKRLKEYRDMDIARVIAERTRADAILAAIGDGVIMFDSDLKVSSANEAALAVVGHDRQQVVGRHFLELFRNEAMFERLKLVFEGKPTPGREDEDLEVERSGRRYSYRYSFTGITTEKGERIGVVLLLQDISKFRELDRLKTEFIMTASHELKTPLTPLTMAVHLLEEANLPERQRELVSSAREEVERLQRTVHELLDLSRIEAGRAALQLQPVDLRALCRRAADAAQPVAKEHGVALELRLDADVPAVPADPERIVLVISNLLDNAVKYTPAGGRVTLAVAAIGNHVLVSVEDNGPGIPPEYQSRVFEPFFRVRAEERQSGTGLGLAIAREVVHAHGGTIWVESEAGKGSRFVFSLASKQEHPAKE
jgi:NtrC-family two-component system sensor histidine kinase KinB